MTESSPDPSLAERVARLEAAVRELQHTLQTFRATPPASPTAPPPPAPHATPTSGVSAQSSTPPPPARPFPPPRVDTRLSPWDRMPEQMKSWEYWLNKLGIGLLLFGVVFLFKYSIDRGWITPGVRVACGIGLGLLLSGLGLRLYAKRRPFATVLLGGGFATFYITGFAAFQFLHIWPFSIAFTFMVAATLFSFLLSLKQDDAVLSLIALAGGLGTPFLLYTGEGNLPGLILYTCLLLALSGGIYFYKGWQVLLWETIIGGWIVLFIALSAEPVSLLHTVPEHQWALQAGFAFAWLMFWAVPLSREILLARFPTMLTPERLGIMDNRVGLQTAEVVGGHVHLWTVKTPILAFFASMAIWQFPERSWGWIALGVAVVLIAVWLSIRGTSQLARLGYTHLLTGLAFVTLALTLLLDGDVLFVCLSAEAAVLVVTGERTRFLPLSIYGHVLFGLVGFWFVVDRLLAGGHASFWTAATMADLFGVLALAFTATATGRVTRQVYVIAAAALLGLILQRELHGDLLMALLTGELMVFHLVARRLNEEAPAVVADFFSAGVGLLLGYRLLLHSAIGVPFLNWSAATDLLTMAVFLGIGMIHRQSQGRSVYRTVVHAAVLVLLWKELSPTINGDGLVSIAWGVYGITMLVVGLRKDIYRLRLVGMLTLLLTVGKLFIVDLARIETIWRILLFLGFGGIFLLLSYYFRALWKPPTHTGTDPTDSAGNS